METINLHYQNKSVGVLAYDLEKSLGFFEYDPEFIKSSIELAPLTMPIKSNIYSFPNLAKETFKGLPGMIADSLPDDFGNAVLNAWAIQQGRLPSEITPLDRLQYIGVRGMGALEYLPATKAKNLNASQDLAIQQLLETAQQVLDSRQNFQQSLVKNESNNEAMLALLSVGTSAGGARAKATLAFNEDFTQVKSGQVKAPEGFTHYLLKFDGVTEHSANQQTFGDPLGFGAMEYVYYLMAQSCGIDIMPSHLLEEGKRRHFVTQRFDRKDNQKVHTQTLTALAHIDYNQPGSYSYAELILLAKQLKLTAKEADQLVRRMIFNLVARNHDDHAKNFSFQLIDKTWTLAPAYDLAYSYKPDSFWVNSHWMSLNGKRDNFVLDDIYSLEVLSPKFTRKYLKSILDEVVEAVSQWQSLAKEWEIPSSLAETISKHLRLKW